jgi:hypothetical protein
MFDVALDPNLEAKPPRHRKSPVRRVPFKKWAPMEVFFLVDEHLSDVEQPNRVLAEACTERFGRLISENAIRGQMTRIRLMGLVPPKRPGTRRKTVMEQRVNGVSSPVEDRS